MPVTRPRQHRVNRLAIFWSSAAEGIPVVVACAPGQLSLRRTKEGSARFPPPAVNKGACTEDGARPPLTEGGLGRHQGKGVIRGREVKRHQKQNNRTEAESAVTEILLVQQPMTSLDLGGAAGLLGGQGERPGCHRRRGTSAHRAAGHPGPAAWAALPSTATSRVLRRGRRARRRSTRRAPLVAGRVAERRDPIVVIYAVSAAARSAVPARRWGSRAASLLGSPKGLYRAADGLSSSSRAARCETSVYHGG